MSYIFLPNHRDNSHVLGDTLVLPVVRDDRDTRRFRAGAGGSLDVLLRLRAAGNSELLTTIKSGV